MTVYKSPCRTLEKQAHDHTDGKHAADAQRSIAIAIGERDKRNGIEPVADLGDDSSTQECCNIPFDEDSAILIENLLYCYPRLVQTHSRHEHESLLRDAPRKLNMFH